LANKALEVGCRVVLPKVSVWGDLELYLVENLSSEVKVGSFGIEEPTGGSIGAVPPELVDCFIVPGVAFDTTGCRLGFGLGYFDRLLARRAPGAVVVALAFECQIRTDLPAEKHDVFMDFICTEERILDCRRQSDRTRAVPEPAVSREVKTT
jgi:5-formyltetrahydrofolate cyclo-ligase